MDFSPEGPQFFLPPVPRQHPGPVPDTGPFCQGPQFHGPFVLFRLFIQEPEDPLRPGQAHDHGVDLGRDHLDIGGKLPAHAQERHHHRQAEGQPGKGQVGHLPFQEQASAGRHDNVDQVAYIVQDGHQGIGIPVGLIGRLIEGLVHPLEIRPGCRLMVEDLDHPAPVDALFHEPFAVRQSVLLGHEIPGAPAPHLPGDDHGPEGASHHHQAHPHTVIQHDGQKHRQGHGGDAQLGEGLGDQLPEGFHIVGVIAHEIPPLVPVEIPQGQGFHMGEQLFPDFGQAALVEHRQELVVGHIGGQGYQVQQGQDPHIPVDFRPDGGPGKILGPGFFQHRHHFLHEHRRQGQDARIDENQDQDPGQQPGIEPPQGPEEPPGHFPAEDILFLSHGPSPPFPADSGTGPFPGRWHWSGAVPDGCPDR